MPRREPNKKKLNDLIIKKLKPRKDRPYLLWDTRQYGLAVQVQPSGVKSWKCIYPFHGRPRWYSIGRVDAIGLTDARKKAGRIMVQVGDGQDRQSNSRRERAPAPPIRRVRL